MPTPYRFVPVLALFPLLVSAQQDRIARIDKSQTVVLTGHVNPAGRRGSDRGRVAPSFPLPHVTLHLKSSAAQQTSLQQLVAEQQDPSSANYHKWLTPEQYASQFGASPADIARITAWLESQGFTVENVARSRTWVTFSGTAEQAQNAFHTEIHSYDVTGAAYYSNAGDPSIPSALAGIVGSLRGLNNFGLKPRLKKSGPENTLGGGRHQIVPDDFATIYNVMPLYEAGITGTGQKIAVVGQTAINLSDIRNFRSRFNLPAPNLEQVLVPGHSDPGIRSGDLDEASLDIEWAGAVARNATIVYVYSKDVITSLHYAIDQNLAPVLSMSYGGCEQADLVDLPTLRTAALQANAQGITWLAAAGDAGAADCEDLDATVAQNGLAVDAPGSIPEVTAMGGSEFLEGGGSYWNSTNNPNSASAMSYIPEKVWNDTAGDGSLSAGGGGTSVYFPKPVWQTGTGVPNESFRHVPDMSLSSSASHDGYFVYTGGSSAYYGGTSVAAPSMAGVVALLNQYLVSSGFQSQPGLGNINPNLYRLALTTPGVFHPIITGDNMVPCASGSPGCTTGSYGFKAASGYNRATGLGSPDATNLIHQWTTAPATGSAIVPSLDQTPVFQQASVSNGNPWAFTITLTEEAGVGTTITAFTVDGKPYDVAATFGSATVPPRGSVSSKNFGLANVAVPKNVVFEFSGVDPSGRRWTGQLSVPFSGPQVKLVVGGVANAASGQAAYAPGEIVSVYGTAMGDFAQSTATIPLPFYLSGFEASVNGVPAALYYVSPNQVNIQIPYGTPSGRVTLTVGNPYENVDYTIQVTSAAPGIFASNGMVAAPFSSAPRGGTTTLFITGEGGVRPALSDGASPAAGTSPARLPKPTQAASLTVAGQPASIAFIGIPPGLVGVTQINYQVPANAPLGAQPVVVTIGSTPSPPVNLNVTP